MAMKILLASLLVALFSSGCATNTWDGCGQNSADYLVQQAECQATPYNNCSETVYFVTSCTIRRF